MTRDGPWVSLQFLSLSFMQFTMISPIAIDMNCSFPEHQFQKQSQVWYKKATTGNPVFSGLAMVQVLIFGGHIYLLWGYDREE